MLNAFLLLFSFLPFHWIMNPIIQVAFHLYILIPLLINSIFPIICIIQVSLGQGRTLLDCMHCCVTILADTMVIKVSDKYCVLLFGYFSFKKGPGYRLFLLWWDFESYSVPERPKEKVVQREWKLIPSGKSPGIMIGMLLTIRTNWHPLPRTAALSN